MLDETKKYHAGIKMSKDFILKHRDLKLSYNYGYAVECGN
jgi:hypothetical protein